MDFTIPQDNAKWANKRVLITGGASGIGEAPVRMCVLNRASVVIADINDQRGNDIEKELQTDSSSVKFIHVDVASWESQVQMYSEALKFFPGSELDVLITSAGVEPKIWDLTPSDPAALSNDSSLPVRPAATTCFEVSLTGSYYSLLIATKYAMGPHKPSTEPKFQKAIILLGSIAGYTSFPGVPDYAAVKYGVRGILKSMRSELPRLGVRVNMMAPFFLDTPMVTPWLPYLQQMGLKLADPVDVCDGVARLALDTTLNGKSFTATSAGLADLKDGQVGTEEAGAESVISRSSNEGLIQKPRPFDLESIV